MTMSDATVYLMWTKRWPTGVVDLNTLMHKPLLSDVLGEWVFNTYDYIPFIRELGGLLERGELWDDL